MAIKDWGTNVFLRCLLGAALALPYRLRVRLMGAAAQRVVAPLAGWNKRVHSNLGHVYPDMSQSARNEIARKVANNVGRMLIEVYSGDGFIAHTKDSEITGPGYDALRDARAAGRPIVLVTGHMGNYDAVRGKLSREGFEMAALYRPMNNPHFNDHYVKAISAIASPVYPTDGRGITSLVRHLKDGGVIGIVADVGSRKAPLLSFFGKPAHTPLSAAEWAVKYDAVMIPIFGLRQDDGFSFKLHVADPIPNGDPAEMMQRYNDTLEALVRERPEQWFWIHRRWKLAGHLSEAATPPE